MGVRPWLLLAMWLLASAGISPATGFEIRPQAPAVRRGPGVTFDAGRLSVKAQSQPLSALLTAIGRKTGLVVRGHESVPDELVTMSVKDVPIEAVLERLLSSHLDLMLVYMESADHDELRLSEIWLFPRHDRALEGTLREQLSQEPDRRTESDHTSLPGVLEALKTRDPRIRVAAVEALGHLAEPIAIASLSDTLRRDEDPLVREAAADAIGKLGLMGVLGRPEAERLLTIAFHDEDENVRDAAADNMALVRGAGRN